ncbi:hypothetical protein CAEBREN_07296 [Caenorhabditis brenneri]|uniref:Uncharacterized protein n=1 Tax=Caenorhabditis brenneri TaxID=135651 RepID=G0MSQ4_CAEBE|nr:hypothetical protein CAEBREN_07296 [Caenorhabditis brenneri]
MSTSYDYGLVTLLPILPRRRLDDKNIAAWTRRDEEIVIEQWEHLEEELVSMDELEVYHQICLEWSLDNADNKEIEEERATEELNSMNIEFISM